jgi:flagellar biosynthesis protein FlhF
MGDFSRFFKFHSEIEKHLVLRADARPADISTVISRFSGLQPDRLLFTGLDEAANCGAMADALIRSGIPLSFVGTGTRIPEDLEQLSASWLTQSVWGERASVAAAAAA